MIIVDLAPIVRQHIHHFSMYDFLWKDDLNANYLEFMKSDPGIGTIEREVCLVAIISLVVAIISLVWK